MSGRGLIATALAASALLVSLYLGLGGADYEPRRVADPCEPRAWREPDGVEAAAEQFALSALDGAACELRVSRETLALALATPESRESFALEHAIDDTELEAALRAGVVRGIDDAESAGALPGLAAAPLREVAERLPAEEAIALIEDASALFEGGADLFNRIEDLF